MERAGFGTNPTVDTGKIGLMYASDFGYARNLVLWFESLATDYFNYTNIYNWLFLEREWALNSSDAFGYDNVWILIFEGGMVAPTPPTDPDGNLYREQNAARPVFYLNSDVSYVSGTGSQEDPYRVA